MGESKSKRFSELWPSRSSSSGPLVSSASSKVMPESWWFFTHVARAAFVENSGYKAMASRGLVAFGFRWLCWLEIGVGGGISGRGSLVTSA